MAGKYIYSTTSPKWRIVPVLPGSAEAQDQPRRDGGVDPAVAMKLRGYGVKRSLNTLDDVRPSFLGIDKSTGSDNGYTLPLTYAEFDQWIATGQKYAAEHPDATPAEVTDWLLAQPVEIPNTRAQGTRSNAAADAAADALLQRIAAAFAQPTITAETTADGTADGTADDGDGTAETA